MTSDPPRGPQDVSIIRTLEPALRDGAIQAYQTAMRYVFIAITIAAIAAVRSQLECIQIAQS